MLPAPGLVLRSSFFSLAAATLLVPVTRGAAESSGSDRLVVLSPSEAMFQEIARLETILGELEGMGSAEAPALAARIQPLRARMERARESAGQFGTTAEPTPALRQIVQDHNTFTERVRADWVALCRDAAALLKSHRLQAPSILDQTARKLLRSGKFDPDQRGTRCNLFVQVVAQGLFAYEGFAGGQDANEMARTMRRDSGHWERLFDPQVDPAEEGVVLKALHRAQELGNRGRLVVVAWENTAEPPPGEESHGHVAVVLPGRPQKSTAWNMEVPLIAQAGDRVFPQNDEAKPEDHKLSEGFNKSMKLQIAVYALKPARK
ncbi:MAG: hypothetical protein HYU36_23740 [Planctomycetes bacterium]|nr:hypothetical protein [Planctomycetota bacterium]